MTTKKSKLTYNNGHHVRWRAAKVLDYKTIYNGSFCNKFMNCSTISSILYLYTTFTFTLQNSIPASQHIILSLVHYNEVLYLITDPLWHASHFIHHMRDTFYDYKWCIYEPNLFLSLIIKNRLYTKTPSENRLVLHQNFIISHLLQEQLV
jgi:hypothetical protein